MSIEIDPIEEHIEENPFPEEGEDLDFINDLTDQQLEEDDEWGDL